MINVYSQKIIREFPLETVDNILEFIKSAKTNPETYIVNEKLEPYQAEYVTHTIVKEDNVTVYKVLLKVKLVTIPQ